jgi:hypothetical protein
MNSKLFNSIFERTINDYHENDDVNYQYINPYKEEKIEYLLYKKCWIDTVQWHLEDIIRNPEIEPLEALRIKRKIDISNQNRTDLVEKIDDFLFENFKYVEVINNARINTETPAWAIDRLSILNLKIYHMQQEVDRTDTLVEHILKCQSKLDILNLQISQLSLAIDLLLSDIQSGTCISTTFKQMKMYNDPELNPIFRKK